MEGRMVMASNRERGNGGVKVIKVESRREKEKEVIVRHEVVTSKWKRWNHDNLLHDLKKDYSV
jgi:hypothetical protein